MRYHLDGYLDQDRVWPAPDGSEIELEAMTPAHRLSALVALRDLPAAPLSRRLRDLDRADQRSTRRSAPPDRAGGDAAPSRAPGGAAG